MSAPDRQSPASDTSLQNSAANDRRLGTTVGPGGKYRLIARLGAGGMGVVYEAVDMLLGRHVALKMLPEGLVRSFGAVGQLLREARAAARLSHPNVVAVLEADHHDGLIYIVMELVRGRSAAAALEACGPLGWREATRVTAEVCRGLVAAHAAGLVHRDIKPANILLADGGAVKLADFGLAKVADESSIGSAAGDYLVGTPHYMSPEQARVDPADHRSDIYSLAASYHALLTGVPPYRSPDVREVLRGHCHGPIPDPRSLNATLPEGCSVVVGRAMAKAPDDRYPNATAMLVDLEALLASAPTLDAVDFPTPSVSVSEQVTHRMVREGGPTRTARQPRLFPPRRRLLWTIAGALLLGLLALGFILWNRRGDERREEPDDGPGRTTNPPQRPPEPWVRWVRGLGPQEQADAVTKKLKELNPGFDGNVTVRIEGGKLAFLELLTDNVEDLSPLRALSDLRSLRCLGSALGKGKVADLSPLRGLSLTRLECWSNRIEDLSPLRGMLLTDLQAAHQPIADLSPLAGMPLRSLTIERTRVADLSPLSGMPLELLYCDHCRVTDLSPLKRLPRLRVLRCDFVPDRDAGILRSLKSLETINGKPAAEFWKEQR